MVARRFRGRIVYRHDSRGVTGREWFEVCVTATGRTVHASCELDDVALLRDVVYSVDAAWRPLDAYVRLTRHDRFQGAAWYWFRDDGVDSEQCSIDAGRVSQFVSLPQRATLFAPHPLVIDGWQSKAFDFQRAAGRQRLEHCTNTSSQPDGSSGPNIGVVYKDLEYLGDTVVCTAAGTFECRHMRIHPLMGAMAGWPPLEFWVAGADALLVRMRWDLLDSNYELVELEGGTC